MRRVGILLVLAGAVLGQACPAAAVEYRLLVANLAEHALLHYLDGRVGRGDGDTTLERLERSLDSGQTPAAAILSDRTIQLAGEDTQRAFGVGARPSVRMQTADGARWLEVRWEGAPGQRVVWMIAPTTSQAPEVRKVALRGTTGGLRYFIVYGAAMNGGPAVVAGYPLQFVHAAIETPARAARLTRGVDVGSGLAVMVGVNSDPYFADHAYLIVDPPPPTTFKAVIAWDGRASLGASPGQPVGVPVSPAR